MTLYHSCRNRWVFSLSLSKLHALHNSCLVNHVTNPNSNEYKPTSIVLDIAAHRIFKPVGIKKDEIDKRSFLKLSFASKDLDGINLGNILHHKFVKFKIPPYSKDQSVLIISYLYTRPIASKKFEFN
jgi:hypothetical protein